MNSLQLWHQSLNKLGYEFRTALFPQKLDLDAHFNRTVNDTAIEIPLPGSSEFWIMQ